MDSPLGSIFGIVIGLASIGAWLTHIVTCITTEAWILLLMGAVVFPVGIIHGAMVWLGYA